MFFKKLIIACIAISTYSAIEIHDADGIRTLSISDDKSPYVFESCDKICITNESERPISMTLYSSSSKDCIKQCEFKGKFNFLSLVMLQAEKVLFLDDSKCDNCVIKQGDEKIHHIIENPAVKFTYIQHADIHGKHDAINAIGHLHSMYCHNIDNPHNPHVKPNAPIPNFTDWMHVIINEKLMPMIKAIEAETNDRIVKFDEKISNFDAIKS